MFKTANQGGCGAPLQLVVRAMPSPGNAPGGGGATSGNEGTDVIEFWGCSRWPECDFRDVLPRRLAQPRLCLEAAGTAGFKVGVNCYLRGLVLACMMTGANGMAARASVC